MSSTHADQCNMENGKLGRACGERCGYRYRIILVLHIKWRKILKLRIKRSIEKDGPQIVGRRKTGHVVARVNCYYDCYLNRRG